MKTFNQFINERKNTVEYKIEEAKLDFLLNISRVMKERDISKSDLAKALGTSKSYITKMLHGDNVNFTIETMVKICNALNGKFETRIFLDDSKQTIDKNTRYKDHDDIWQRSLRDNKLDSSSVNVVVKLTIQPKTQWF